MVKGTIIQSTPGYHWVPLGTTGWVPLGTTLAPNKACQRLGRVPAWLFPKASVLGNLTSPHPLNFSCLKPAGVAWGEPDMRADINGWKIALACQLERKLSRHSKVVVYWSDALEKIKKHFLDNPRSGSSTTLKHIATDIDIENPNKTNVSEVFQNRLKTCSKTFFL